MSRRKSQSLAEDLMRTIDPAVLRQFRNGRGFLDERGPAFDRRLTPAQARQIREADKQLRRERRASSMQVLLWRQYAPWVAAFGVMVLGGVEWLIRWLVDLPTAVMFASLAGFALAWSAWMVGRRTRRWRNRLHLAAGIASVWLLWTAATGPSWRAVLVLALGTVVSSSSWWKANRPAYPKAPVSVPVPVKTDLSYPVLWAENLGAPGAILAGSKLTDPDTSRPNCESYMLVLVAGKQSFLGTVRYLDLVAGGLHIPVERLVLEPHEDRNPNHVKLTIVQVSPIDKTMPYSGARIVGAQRNAIEIGPYGDGDGFAQWQMWRPGEKPMTGSWLSGLVIAKTGGGKSRLMELLAAGYMATGSAIVWFADPQGGASSPAMQEYADWYVSGERVAQMIGALEAIAEGREKEMGVKKWSRFEPSPQRPGIVVILEEGHVIIKRYGKRLSDLARKTQKVGISFIVFTQGASLESLGDDILRASLTTNLIVMRTGSNQTKNLLPGLTVDPEMLPEIPGFGYMIGMGGTRTAPYRAELIEQPEKWFQLYRMPKLDPLSANAAGDVYGLRREATAQEQEANRRWVEAMEAGVQPTLNEDEEPEQDEPAQGGAFQVAQFPTSPAERPQDKPSWQRVLAAVGNGVTRTDEIAKVVGLGKSQLHAVLKKLVEERHLEQPTKGVYALAGSATPPER